MKVRPTVSVNHTNDAPAAGAAAAEGDAVYCSDDGDRITAAPLSIFF